MKYIIKFIIWIRNLWQQRDLRRRLIIIESDTPPEKITTKHLYLARKNGKDWAVAMLCPCGCGDHLQLRLLKVASTHWTLKTPDHAPPTLHPSVWRKTGCRSHFWVKDGKIKWC